MITQLPLETALPEAFLGYSKFVILHRAIPDVRDGLKPVHRRIIYAMNELNMDHNKAHSKSARLVGHCMGSYHPHGDSSIYDAAVRMAQPWATRYPMVDGHGNFGSIDGDNAAAMRYTELRMTPLSELMCQDIDKNTISFIPNYDNRLNEPTVLPSPLPNILLNGTSGIAVGMASNMPPHNLKEVIRGIIAQMDNPKISLDELMAFIPGPDFPTGGKIIGLEGIRDAYETGRGKVIMRGTTAIERGKGGKSLIVITEIPYQVNKANLAAKIELLSEEKIEGILDVRDESDREGMRLVVECHKDTNPQIVLQQIYKYTQLQETFGVINLVIDPKGTPVVMGLKDIITAYIKHRQLMIRRRTEYDLMEAKARAHILEAMVVAINNLDEVIQIIRLAKNSSMAKANLVLRFEFDDIQVQAILDLKLQHLTGLELESIRKEYDKLLLVINDFKDILNNKYRIDSILKNELLGLSSRYADDRRTVILAKEDLEKLAKEDRIGYFFRDGHFQWTETKGGIDQITLPEDTEGFYFLFVTRHGQVMRSPVSDFLRARTDEAITLKDDDTLVRTFLVGDSGEIMILSCTGQSIRFKVSEISIQGRKSCGVRGMNTENTIPTALYIDESDIGKRLVTMTENGYTKQTLLTEYPIQGRGGKGLIATLVNEKTGLLVSTVLSDGTGKHKKIPLEGRAKFGQVMKT